MKDESLLHELLGLLPSIPSQHAPGTPLYSLLRRVARLEIETRFSSEGTMAQPFGPFGTIIFPYVRMGTTDSMNLFDFDELIIFSFNN